MYAYLISFTTLLTVLVVNLIANFNTMKYKNIFLAFVFVLTSNTIYSQEGVEFDSDALVLDEYYFFMSNNKLKSMTEKKMDNNKKITEEKTLNFFPDGNIISCIWINHNISDYSNLDYYSSNFCNETKTSFFYDDLKRLTKINSETCSSNGIIKQPTHTYIKYDRNGFPVESITYEKDITGVVKQIGSSGDVITKKITWEYSHSKLIRSTYYSNSSGSSLFYMEFEFSPTKDEEIVYTDTSNYKKIHSKLIRTYDNDGYCLETISYDGNGKVEFKANYIYEKDNCVETIFTNDNETKMYYYKYDAGGNVTAEYVYENSIGKKTLTNKYYYNEKGLIEKKEYFDKYEGVSLGTIIYIYEYYE
jgi:hypothetical protein